MAANGFHELVSFSSAEEVEVDRDFVWAAYFGGYFCYGGGEVLEESFQQFFLFIQTFPSVIWLPAPTMATRGFLVTRAAYHSSYIGCAVMSGEKSVAHDI